MPDDTGKATLSEVRAFFEDGSRKLAAAEIMALKKDRVTKQELIDYDQVALGIGNGSFNYVPTDAQVKAAQAL